MRHYAKSGNVGCAYTIVVNRPDPGSVPIPRHPAARIIRAYKLRQQPVEAPGAWTARGSFLWRVKPLLAAPQDWLGCVSCRSHGWKIRSLARRGWNKPKVSRLGEFSKYSGAARCIDALRQGTVRRGKRRCFISSGIRRSLLFCVALPAHLQRRRLFDRRTQGVCRLGCRRGRRS
jgi:hypothetical protein